ncbi:response regulator [uncultured Gemmiger sp.]|uniref:response regulator n=1 Tax=uncultured Gemmiger sp. TaxID=1623490 RepID=UPI00345DD39D
MKLKRFPNADEFLKADTHAFDIVFMDIDMPGSNGINASRELRKTNKATACGCLWPVCSCRTSSTTLVRPC